MWQQVKDAKSENRYELLIVGNELSTVLSSSNGILDPAIFSLTQLNFLRLAGSTLSELPDELGNLKNLTNLELNGNNLSTLPKSIKNLTKLKLLDVSENKLTKFPDEMNHLESLKTLNARKNELQQLIPFLNCTSLGIIDIRMNKLTSLDEICHEKLISVTEINASDNQIECVPEEIKCLTNLRNLFLSDNCIKEMHSDVLKCPKLKEISLKGNPLSDRRFKKMVESDRGFSRTILAYIKQHCNDAKGKKDSSKSKAKNKDVQGEKINLAYNTLCVTPSTEKVVVQVNSDVREIRAFLVCCCIHNLNLSGPKMKTFLAIQTKLHESICDKRVGATIATHDLRKVVGPLLHYCAKLPQDIRIHPLNKSGVVTAKDFMKSLKTEADAMRKQMKRNTYSGIHKYLSLVEGLEKWPCIEDAKQTVISLPPITNSHDTKMEEDTMNVLVEVTSGLSLKKAKDVMEALLLAILEADLTLDKTEEGKNQVIVEQVRILDEEGNLRLVYPSKTDLAFTDDKMVNVIRKH